MKIGSLCTRRVVTIDEDGTLGQAAMLMREHHVGALVVTARTAQGLRIGGLVTDRDLVIEVLARGLDPAAGRIGELASTDIASVCEDDDLTQAIAAMQRAGVRRLLVTDAEQRLSGIVSLDDLVHACASQFTGLADVIRAGLDREVDDTNPTPPLPPTLLRIPAVGTAGWGQAA
jgi:CBS domain-containing protein